MKALINIRIENSLKKQVQEVAADLGFTMSALVNAFFKQLAREKAVSFSVSNKASKKLEDILVMAEKDIAENKNLSPKFSDPQKAVDYLKSL